MSPQRSPRHSVSRRATWLSVLLLVALSFAPPTAARPKNGSTGFERFDIALTGRPLSVAPDAAPDGSPGLLVLIADEVAPPEDLAALCPT